MARPRVTDEGDNQQILRVAMNIMNNQTRTADKEWSSAWEFREEQNNSSP